MKIRKHNIAGLLVVAGAAYCIAASSFAVAIGSKYREILKSYTFVGDFSQKADERPVSEELFWRYPLKSEPIDFHLVLDFQDPTKEFPKTMGDGLPYAHINMGRDFYLKGDYEEARKVWLTGRARFGNNYEHHRRNDYFLGLSFLQLASIKQHETNLPWVDPSIRAILANAATFLSWAFIIKKDLADPVVDQVMPKELYNLAATYYLVDRQSGAYGAATAGMEYLRRTGRKEFRPQFHRILAEANIKNRTYLQAVQELDAGIRQDEDPVQASAMFARAGDIYFDLNNFELAEDSYHYAATIDQELGEVSAHQLALRGEALFWLGKFSDSQKVLYYALETPVLHPKAKPLSPLDASWVNLRLADAYLARHDLEKAKLEYFRVAHDYRGTEAERVAKIRSACLELPYYKGNNIKHARDLLDESKAKDLPKPAIELAWACHVASYTERERTEDMLSRVRTFADSYPESRFLKAMAEPVREFQATKIDTYFRDGDTYRAMAFFEATRKLLFPKVSADLGGKLFSAYVDAFRSDSAAEFWGALKDAPDSDRLVLQQVVAAAELADRKRSAFQVTWHKRAMAMAHQLESRNWTEIPNDSEKYVARVLATKDAKEHYVWIERLATAMAAKKARFICDLRLPLLEKMVESNPARHKADAEKFIDQFLVGEDKRGAICRDSILNFEARIFANDPTRLAQRYLTRSGWSWDAQMTSLAWNAAEANLARNNRQGASMLWKMIQDKAPKGSPEIRYASARLDPSKTELEGVFE